MLEHPVTVKLSVRSDSPAEQIVKALYAELTSWFDDLDPEDWLDDHNVDIQKVAVEAV